MRGLIAAREVREWVRDGRLLWAGGLMVVLLVTSIAVSWRDQASQHAERTAAQALDYEAWLNQGPRHPHNAADQGMHVFKPAPSLAAFDPGIQPYVGSTLWLQSHAQSEMKFRPAQDATGLQRFGGLSAAWVLQVLSPLLLIILGFGAFAGEREQGTLRQLLSLGVPKYHLLVGKAVAMAGCLGILLLPGAMLGIGFGVLAAPPGAADDTLLRILWIAIGYGLYLGIVIFVVLGVSALSRTSRMALFSLLAIWIAGTLIAPRTISDFAGAFHPSPSRMSFESTLSDHVAEASKRAWVRNFGVETQWDPALPLSKWGRALQVDDHAGYAVYDQHFGNLWDTFERQQRFQQWAGMVAPVVAVRSLSMAFAGTDFSQHRDFSEAAERQRRVIQDVVSDDLVRNADPLGDRHFSYKAGPEVWAKVPRFEYRLPRVGFVLQRHWPSLVVLFVMFVLAGGFAHLAALRRVDA